MGFHDFYSSGSQLTVTDLEHTAYHHTISHFMLKEITQNMYIFMTFSDIQMMVATQRTQVSYASLASTLF